MSRCSKPGPSSTSSASRWCLVALRWAEALEVGMVPRIVLAATHQATPRYVQLDNLKKYALDLT
ncbi:MAG: DUF2237 family protein [Devosia sp.]|nr:DUF2237 family protein [Devosia sp.]